MPLFAKDIQASGGSQTSGSVRGVIRPLKTLATLMATCSFLVGSQVEAFPIKVAVPTASKTSNGYKTSNGGGSSGTSTSSVPTAAAAAGYNTETFATVSNFTTQTVDMKLTNGPGFQWYWWNFFGNAQTPGATTLNSDGSVTLAAFTNTWPNLASAVQTSSAPYYRGTAFGGGGYFEATLAYDASTVNVNTGWPSFWSMALEHLVYLPGVQWPGQASGYEHFIEPDFFEADVAYWAGANTYGGDTHDWYGLWGSSTCPNYCNVDLKTASGTPEFVRTVPSGTNFSQYHRYGFLWVPATATTPGKLSYYFDGVQVGPTTTYTQYTSQPPVPTTATPWTFGVIDKQHLVLVLGTGASTPMQVQSVTVWQASSASNMHN